jgi:hypothetical protein
MANTNTPAIGEAQVVKTWNFSQNADGSLSPSVSIGGANASVGVTGVPAPAAATEMGIVDALGKLQAVSALNPLPIVGSIVASNPSVGTTGILAPTSATEIGVIDALGKLQAASSSNPVRIDPTGVTTQPVTDATIAANGSNPAPTSSTQVGFVNKNNGNFVPLAGFVAGGVNALATTLVDGAGIQLAVGDNAAPPDVIPVGFSAMGYDPIGNKVRALTVDTSQNLKISASSLPLPTGASTSAKQPALGTAGTASVDVLTVQGIASMTPLKVDGSGVTQPVNLAQIAGVTVVAAAAGVQKVGIVGGAGTSLETTAGILDHNVKNIANVAVVTAAAGVQKVGVVGGTGTSFETTAGILDENIKNIGNSPVVTAAAGVQKVGLVGNANATLDSTIGAATAPTNALAVGHVYQSTVPALTAGQAVAAQCDTAGSAYVDTEGRKQTYRMSVRGFTPIASATSPLFSIQGSGTKTIRIIRIKITWSCTTGNALPNDISLQKFSALTGGTTGNTPTGAKNDTNNAAQTAICLQYSAVPTTATVIGGISAVERIAWVTSGATVVSVQPAIDWYFGTMNQQQLVLRGTSEFYGIVCAAVGTTPVMSIWIEWEEE